MDVGRTRAQRAQGRAGRLDRGLHRRVQLRREQDLDPDPQRGRHPADQPREHVQRAHDRLWNAASRASTTRPVSRTYFRIVPERPRPGRRARHRDARPRLQGARRRARRRGLRQGHEHAMSSPPRARFGLPVVANRRISRSAPSADPPRQGRTAWPTPASRPTAPCGCSAPARCAACSSSAATAWPRRASWGACRVRSTAARSSPSRRSPDAYPDRSHRQPRPVLVYGYEAMKLILDGLTASGGDQRGPARLAARPSRTARACSAPTASTPTATRRCAPTGSTASSARARSPWTGDDHRRLSSSEAVELELDGPVAVRAAASSAVAAQPHARRTRRRRA